MVSSSLTRDINTLIRRAQREWLENVCLTLDSATDVNGTTLIAHMPATNNGDLAHCLADIIRQAEGSLSWKALGAALAVCAELFSHWQRQQSIELLWSGPSPASQIPARRIDQILYDLISSAKRRILLVTFAAYKVARLSDALVSAISRGVQVRLILEFEQASKGQLSTDALNAFPEIIRTSAQIYYWPLNRRELNKYGMPGKLHAKVAIIDNQAVLSSANMTDDALTRNLELGALISNEEFLQHLRCHFEGLCVDGTLKLWHSKEGK